MPPPQPKPPVTDLMVLGMAALIHAFNPTVVSPREAFVSARAFVKEAEEQMPFVMKILTTTSITPL